MPTKPTISVIQPIIPNHRSWSGNGFYQSQLWINLRNAYRQAYPLCCECEKKGKTVLMNVVDHKIAISNGGASLDWDNLQSLCTSHHNSKSRKEQQRP